MRKKREVKVKGEKERHIHLNAEFQRIARRSERAFLSDQCKEIEENNRMGKTRDLLKKIRDTNRIFHAKMGTIKDRNGMDLTEAEDNKNRWQEYTDALYKKDLHDPDNHSAVITHLEPDILECEVKWALGSITMNNARVGDGIPAELFQILKDDAFKVLQVNMPANLENSSMATGLEKVSFHSNPKEKQCQKCSRMFKLLPIALISHTSKEMLHILHVRLQQSMKQNLKMFKMDLENAEEPEIKLPTSFGSKKKQANFRKTYTSALLTMPKTLTEWITTNCGKFFKR